MKTLIHFLSKNSVLLLFLAGMLVLAITVVYALTHTFGWWSLVFLALSVLVAWLFSKLFISALFD